MTSSKWGARVLAAPILIGLLSPAAKADDAKATGVLAGLGVAAASGKTTLGGNAGTIEAEVLNADGFQRAGAIIAGVVNHQVSGERVIVLTHDQPIDLASWQIVRDRLVEVNGLVRACRPAPHVVRAPKPHGGKVSTEISLHFPPTTEVMASDFVGAALTDVAISGITLSADDRMLVTAIAMNGSAPVLPKPSVGWTIPGTTPSGGLANYVIPSDMVGLPDAPAPAAGAGGGAQTAGGALTNGEAPTLPISTTPTVRAAYAALLASLQAQRSLCSQTDGGKATLAIADGLVNGLNTASATGTPLANAIQLEQLSGSSPHVLRVAVEQVGGTAILRSGVAYTFGWPNAATVSAGLIVSFRLSDPRSGRIEAIGVVRCMVGQTNIKHVPDALRHSEGGTNDAAHHRHAQPVPLCDYQARAL